MNVWFRCAAFFMLTGVLFGAFGAHGLKHRLAPELLKIYETGVLYHFIHAGALFVVAWATTMSPSSKIRWAGYCFIAGILIFSGSLYLLSITGTRWLGAITPIGGLLFLIAWALLFFA
jgi:uncharacterized membrane protein YgdD (TMEM256/DUF423 family)